MAKIVGNHDGNFGKHKTYKIGLRMKVPRSVAVEQVRRGDHPGYHLVVVNGVEYVRDNHDIYKSKNLIRNKI